MAWGDEVTCSMGTTCTVEVSHDQLIKLFLDSNSK